MQVAQRKAREATEEVNARVENDHDNIPSSFFLLTGAALGEAHVPITRKGETVAQFIY